MFSQRIRELQQNIDFVGNYNHKLNNLIRFILAILTDNFFIFK